MRYLWIVPIIVSVVLFFPIAAKGAIIISVDGDITDWGVSSMSTQVDRANSEWLSPLVDEFVEDDIGVPPHYIVGPGPGGQNFDIEAMYGFADQDDICIAIVTGFDQAGQYNWPVTSLAGDIFLDFGADGIWDAAVDVSGPNAGKVYTPKSGVGPTEWWIDPILYPVARPMEIVFDKVDFVVDLGADFIYTDASPNDYLPETQDPNDHNVIELIIPRTTLGVETNAALLGAADLFIIHWTQDCGNDVGELSCTIIPEPITMLILGFGICLFVLQLRRRKI